MEWLNVLGVVLTAVGTFITIWQARRVKRYRDEISADRSRMALIDMYSLARHAREECKKLAPQGGQPLRGVAPPRVIAAIRDSVERMQDNLHKVQSSDCEVAIAAIAAAIAKYSQAYDTTKGHVNAEELYSALNTGVNMIARSLNTSL